MYAATNVDIVGKPDPVFWSRDPFNGRTHVVVQASRDASTLSLTASAIGLARPLFHEARGRIAPKRSCWQSINPISSGDRIADGPPLDHADYDVRLRPTGWQFVRSQGGASAWLKSSGHPPHSGLHERDVPAFGT